MGLACLVGQLTPIFSWTGPDAATHMCKSRMPLCTPRTISNNEQPRRSRTPL
jgi:hypothetical protein